MTDSPKYRGFTKSYDTLTSELITPIGIVPILIVDKSDNNAAIEVDALWDTGATVTCIKPELFKRLNLRIFDETGQTKLAGVGGETPARPTIVNLFITPELEIEYCPVYVVDFPGNVDVLIGMDIIQMGDFAICNADAKTSFSFSMPPFPERINLAERAEATNRSP